MRICSAPGLSPGTMPGTLGYSYHSLPGPKFQAQAANAARTGAALSQHSDSQGTQAGMIAAQPAPTVRGTDFDLLHRDDSDGEGDSDSS